MYNISIEQIIKTKQPTRALVYKILMVLLSVLSVISIYFIWTWGMLLSAVVIALTVVLFKYYDAEYEYALVESQLSIDRIMAKSRRKHCKSFDISKATLIAEADSNDALRLEKAKMPTYSYTDNDDNPQGMVVIYLANANQGQTRLIIQPNEKLLAGLKKVSGKGVYKVTEKND